MSGKTKQGQSEWKNKIGKTLIHPDGRTVTFVEEGTDEKGDFLILEHRITEPGVINGPHWHPVLTESFKVREGSMRFLVDGHEKIVGPGEEIMVYPNQVHQFWNTSDQQLVAIHEIRPPGLHWKMFVLVHKLECEGKMNNKGIPRNPLWLGVAWECIDGYLVGPPQFVQKVFLRGLASLAKVFGYQV